MSHERTFAAKGVIPTLCILPLCFASLASSAPLPPPTVIERGIARHTDTKVSQHPHRFYRLAAP